MLPQSWKDTHIVPIPKQKREQTPPSNVTDTCVIQDHRGLYGGIYYTCHISQSRSIWKSSKNQYYYCTSMLHACLSETVLIDFQKAFNLLFHEILLQKHMTSGLHSSIVTWVKDLLTDHRQQSSFLRIVILNGGIFHLESQKRLSWICGSLVSWSITYQLEEFPCGSM